MYETRRKHVNPLGLIRLKFSCRWILLKLKFSSIYPT
ncbi:hypothetical protein LINPERPRIM_LOCUS25871 [Linum perenne]